MLAGLSCLGLACFFYPVHVRAAPLETPLADDAEREIPTLPISVAVATQDGAPVVEGAWIDAQVARATELIGAHGVRFDKQVVRSLPERFARLENRADRNALGDHTERGFINVFVVASLRDVDDATRLRMGVHWRKLSDLKNRYIIIAASARSSTLAHELGHYLGNPHTSVENNLMSYKRTDESKVFLDAAQGQRCRNHARMGLLTGELKPAQSSKAQPPSKPR